MPIDLVTDIAGVQPTVLAEHRPGRGLVLEITAHHAWAPEENLAALARPDLVVVFVAYGHFESGQQHTTVGIAGNIGA
jgi:hypothetical protein